MTRKKDEESHTALSNAHDESLHRGLSAKCVTEPKSAPTEEGAWWYEHAHYPVVVRKLDRSEGLGFYAFLPKDGWRAIKDLNPGWWSGPLVKPTYEETNLPAKP
jgi:hypothetical protein